ncbi:MAG: small ribosomal subunit Rsm22 family protein [Myxococcales bacterium]
MTTLIDRVPALLGRARALLGLPPGAPDRLAPGELRRAAQAVGVLHEGLVGRRALARAGTYDDPDHLGAYLLWWWPQTYAKVQAVLALARSAATLPAIAARPRILDVGAGPAPAALALLDAVGGSALALDSSGAALSEASALSRGAVATRQVDLGDGLPPLDGVVDLVVVANALSELAAGARAALIDGLPLAAGGAVLLVEPALRETGRALLELRDELLRSGRWAAAAPCLTQRPCPALEHPREWCTALHAWQPPPHVAQLAAELGLRADQALAYAPLVLTKNVAPPPRDVWRVVGVPPDEKGKKRLFVCSDQGRVPVARLDRDTAPANADFDRLERGDLVLLGGLGRRGDGLRIGRESEVRRVEAGAQMPSPPAESG